MQSGEARNTNFIVFDLTRPVLEPTIYHARCEHANHYTNDAVQNVDSKQTFYMNQSFHDEMVLVFYYIYHITDNICKKKKEAIID